MALIPSSKQIQIISAIHLSLAYILIFQPALMEDQALVRVVGGAMHLPHTDKFGDPKNRALTTFLGVMFALFGITDMISTGVEQLAYRAVWANQAPIRVFMFFCLVGYAFIFKASRPTFINPTTAIDSLKSDIIFTWAMFESIAWYWIFSTLRDERKHAIAELENRSHQD